MENAMGWSTPQGNRRCFNAVDGLKPQKFKSMELQRTVDPLFGSAEFLSNMEGRREQN